MKHTWYAVRLKPGASARSRADTRISKIEYSLDRAEVKYYLPLERKETVHNRKKIIIDKSFPLLPGYVFVADIKNWTAFRQIHFVGNPVSIAGNPLIIREEMIEKIRDAEMEIYEEYQFQKGRRIQVEKEREERANGMSAKKAKQIYPAGSPVVVGGSHMLRGMKGTVVSATGRNTIKLIIETLDGHVNAEISTAHLEMVA